MPQRKIDVVFYVPNYDDFGTTIPVTRITAAQLAQMQENVVNAKIPATSCINSITMTYMDRISFLDGGRRCNRQTGRCRELEIKDLFWLSDGKFACGTCRQKNDIAMMRHCAHNLRAGRCRDAFMRNTIGAVLFPALYAKDKQK